MPMAYKTPVRTAPTVVVVQLLVFLCCIVCQSYSFVQQLGTRAIYTAYSRNMPPWSTGRPSRYQSSDHPLSSSTSQVRQTSSDDDEEGLGIQNRPFKSGFVSILGNPNVGKSTLMNEILGQRLCIVSPKPQTTRHRILGVVTEDDFQLVFSDTPGMVAPAYKLQETMMDSVRHQILWLAHVQLL